MNNNLFLPKKIKVGYQNRSDTYTKKLAYIVYYDNDGVLRKEKSWEGWRDTRIKADEFENIPMEGFVLNKRVGGKGGGWDVRQAYIRVYDPRGFEFEITLENLLFILEHNSCIKGKGLEGEYIYVWNHTELFLMPTNADIYNEIVEYNKKLTNAVEIKAKDLQPGYVYLSKKNEKYVYLEKHEKLDYDNQSIGQYYWFAKLGSNGISFHIEDFKNVKGKFIEVFSTTLPSNFEDINKQLKKERGYASRILDFTWEEIKNETTIGTFLNDISTRMKREQIFVFYEGKYRSIWYSNRYNYDLRKYDNCYRVDGKNKEYETLEEFKDCKFYIKKRLKGR